MNIRPGSLFLLVITALGMTCHPRADMLTDWNGIATALVPAAGKNPVEQSRVFAMVHAATHDVLNAIEPRYRPYAFKAQVAEASPEAAVATAAYAVLTAQVPSLRAALDTAYAASLSIIPSGSAKDNGIAAGLAAAATIINLRSSDGSTSPMPYTPGDNPGDWVPTPPGFVPAALPGWGNVTPFALRSGEQFRPDPPDFFDLSSDEYACDYNEVKTIGDQNSAVRTADQSEIARFWYEGSPTGWNRIARVLSMEAGLDLWENARLLALLNFAMADGYIAGFHIKYYYSFWRPVTSIQRGDVDGNPATAGDPSWLPYLVTPQSPDFPSTHGVLGAAAGEVLACFFGTDFVAFSTVSGPPFAGITRSYRSFKQAAQENADSRIYAGIHFRSACRHGLRVGEKIGAFTFKHYLQPIDAR